jgi:hypothetical protein
MYGATSAVLVSHLLFVFEDVPMLALASGLAAHGCYFWLLQSYPFLSFSSPPFLSSLALFCVSNFLWISHFLSHFHQMMSVLCFMLWMAWLVPFGFFISVSCPAAEAALAATAAAAAHAYAVERRSCSARATATIPCARTRHRRPATTMSADRRTARTRVWNPACVCLPPAWLLSQLSANESTLPDRLGGGSLDGGFGGFGKRV